MAALLIAAAGCTLGDDSTEVVVDDGGDAMATLSGAMESLQVGSGRFRQTVSFVEAGGTAEEFAGEFRLEGSFTGTDVESVSTFDFGDMPEPVVTRERAIGSKRYTTTEGSPDGVPGWPDGTWVEYDLEDEDEVIDPTGGMMSPFLQDGAALVDSVEGLAQASPVELDGTSFRSFEGSVGLEGADALLSGGEEPYDETEGMSADDRARFERIRAYESARTPIRVEVLVGEDGTLRRLILEGTSDIEPQYARCSALFAGGDFRFELEVFDRGAPIEIVAPDPATVKAWDDPSLFGSFADDPEFDEDGMMRGFLEEEVHAGAWVIGLDPATIPALSDDELVDLQQRIAEASQQLPTVETVLGPMNRLELLSTVAIGLEMEGADPASVEGLSDQQLAELIEAYLTENPDLAPTNGDEGMTDDALADEELISDEYFEGCPA
jgi:hypothetical protein